MTTVPLRRVDRAPRSWEQLASRAIASSGRTVVSVDPCTEETLAELPVSTPGDVDVAMERARSARHAWAGKTLEERAGVLLRLHDLVLDRADEVLDVIQRDSGKSRRDAFEELCDVAMTARYYGLTGHRVLAPRRRAGLFPLVTGVRELRHPLGVVGIISPWNYPFTLAISDALPALLAGNAVVHKPATETALTALFGLDLLAEAGLPAGVWQVVLGEGRPVGGAVVDQADFVCFTGSTAAGREIGRRCGERLVGCSLELGGKNALLVLEDADIERAAEGAVRACFSNAGQLCVAMERVYVCEGVYDRFLRRFLERVGAMRLGASRDFGPDMGSLIGGRQLARVREHVDDAVERGARVLAGGAARPDLGPYFFEPTVLAEVTAQMRCAREETFGPVVAVYRVPDEEEAIARANATPYGLNASVYSGDRRRGRAVAARLRAGSVNVNEGYAAAWGSLDAPMGGMGDSGLGRRHGTEGLRRYTQAQTIAVQRWGRLAPPDWMGFGTFAGGLTGALRVLRKVRRP